MKKFGQYSLWILAFVFCVGLIAVYKTVDNFNAVTRIFGMVVDALKPFIVGFVIAYILNLPCRKIRRNLDKISYRWVSEHSLGISIFVVYIIAIITVAIVIGAIVPALYRNILDLYTHLPGYIETAVDYLNTNEFFQKIRLFENFDVNKTFNELFNTIDMAKFSKYAQGVFHVTSSIFSIFISIIVSVYMLIDKETIQKSVARVLSIFMKDRTVLSFVHQTARVNDIFTNYIYSRLLTSVIMGGICSVVLALMRVKYALVLGLFIGACDLIPYFGSIVATIVVVVINFITGSFWQSVWLAVVLIVLQQIDGNLLAPKIMGHSLEIRPLWIIFAVTVGGSLFGVLGMVLSVPVLAVIRVVLADYIDAKEQRLCKQTEEGGDQE
jgi:predicted PurR-regulated permease PerM